MIRMMLILVVIVLFLAGLRAENIPYIQLKPVATTTIPAEMLIPDLGSVVVDATGNVFGFAGKHNGSECFVIKWDENLRFIKSFMRHGFGPGEATMNQSSPDNRLSIDPTNGDVVVQDINPLKLIIFDKNGIYKTDIYPLRINLELEYMNTLKSLGNSNYFAFKWVRDTWNTDCMLLTLNPFKVKLLHAFNDKPMIAESGTSSIQFNRNFCGSTNFVDVEGGNVVVANSQFYKVHLFDRFGNKKLEIVDKSKKIGSFTSKEMAYIKEKEFTRSTEKTSAENNRIDALTRDKATFNILIDLIEQNKNLIQGVLLGGDHIYLFLINDDISVENKIPTVIFDLKGNIVKKVYFKKIPSKIWKRFAYYIELDSEDNPSIHKYQILDKY